MGDPKHHRRSVRHLLSVSQLSLEEIQEILNLSSEMEEQLKRMPQLNRLPGRILASLFFEPSTRTRFSFEAAILKLGGSVIQAAGSSSSLEKGESFEDTGRVLSRLADVIVLRHPLEHAVHEVARGSSVPVINAGNGSSEHPTQALLDLYSISKAHPECRGLKVGFVGDLLYGRAAHSTIEILSRFETQFALISHPSLRLSSERLAALQMRGCQVLETQDLQSVLPELDVLYVTRVQKERFSDPSHYEAVKNAYRIDATMLKKAKKTLSLLHPLPRLDEIAGEVDHDPRAGYWDQVSNGVFVRMAVLAWLTQKSVSSLE